MSQGITLTFAGDESGDASFRFGKGASRYFVMAMIATEHPDDIRGVMNELKRELRLPDRYEFKYHKLTSSKAKSMVFQTLSQQNFHAWAIIVDKTGLNDSFRFLTAMSFYLYFLTELIQAIPKEETNGATLILDEFSENSKISLTIRKFLKARGINAGFKRILARDSESEPLIQLADLIAGSVAHRDSESGSELSEVLLSKVLHVYEFSA